jgi:hypothetical protein
MIIKSQRIKRALLTALVDEEMLKIMNCVIDRSKSFNDIIAENSSIRSAYLPSNTISLKGDSKY